MKSIELNGTSYHEGSKCPACSSERDKGGRLELKKRVQIFLKCNLCRYSILSRETRNKADRYVEKMLQKRAL